MPKRRRHRLEKELRLSWTTVMEAIARSNRILVAVKGAIAQEQLRRHLSRLRAQRRITSFSPIDKDGKPDFQVSYRGSQHLVECKNVQKTLKNGEMTVDFMRTRYAKTKNPSARFYNASEFDILAACLFNQTGKWEFKFIPTTLLDPHPTYPKRLDSKLSLGKSKTYYRHWRLSLPAALRLAQRHG